MTIRTSPLALFIEEVLETPGLVRLSCPAIDPDLVAEASVPFDMASSTWSRIAWLFEAYPSTDREADRARADSIKSSLSDLGTLAFKSLVQTHEAVLLWSKLEPRLAETHVRVVCRSRAMRAFPWELLATSDNTNLASLARSFCYTTSTDHALFVPLRRAPRRMLLVVSRPARARDIPFRAVASGIVAAVSRSHRPMSMTVLRPPSFDAFCSELAAEQERGEPYDIVHFDGHGVLGSELQEFGPAVEKSGLFLLFEDENGNPQLIDAKALASALSARGVSILSLNACRSGYVPDEDRTDDYVMSFSEQITANGVPATISMRFAVYPFTACRFFSRFVDELQNGALLEEAFHSARRDLFRGDRFGPDPRDTIPEWVLPVLHTNETALDRQKIGEPYARTELEPRVYRPYSPNVPDGAILDLEHQLQRHNAVILTGMAGCGKSTVAREFLHWFAQTSGPVPVRTAYLRIVDDVPSSVLTDELEHHFDGQHHGVWVWDFDPCIDVSGQAADQSSVYVKALEQASALGVQVVVVSRHDHPAFLPADTPVVRHPRLDFRSSSAMLMSLLEPGHVANYRHDLGDSLAAMGGNPTAISILADCMRQIDSTDARGDVAGTPNLVELVASADQVEDLFDVESEDSGVRLHAEVNAALRFFKESVHLPILTRMLEVMRTEEGDTSEVKEDEVRSRLDALANAGVLDRVTEDSYAVHPLFGLREPGTQHGVGTLGVAFADAVSSWALHLRNLADHSGVRTAIAMLSIHETDLLSAESIAVAAERWEIAGNACEGLVRLYIDQQDHDRHGEVVERLRSYFVDESGGPSRPGLERYWVMTLEHTRLRGEAVTPEAWARGVQVLEQQLEGAADHADHGRASLLRNYAAAVMYSPDLQSEETLKRVDDLISRCVRDGRQTLAAQVCRQVAEDARQRSDWAAAKAWFERAHSVAEEHDTQTRAACLLGLGGSHFSEALDISDRSRSDSERLECIAAAESIANRAMALVGDLVPAERRIRAACCSLLGRLAHLRGDAKVAEDNYRDALMYSDDQKAPEQAADALVGLAILMSPDRPAEAKPYVQDAIRILKRASGVDETMLQQARSILADIESDVASEDAIDRLFDEFNDLYRSGEYAECADRIAKLGRIDELPVKTAYLLGLAEARLGRHENAIAAFSTVAERETQWSEPLANIGNSHLAMRRFDEAVQAYQAALERNPADMVARNNLPAAKLMADADPSSIKWIDAGTKQRGSKGQDDD